MRPSTLGFIMKVTFSPTLLILYIFLLEMSRKNTAPNAGFKQIHAECGEILFYQEIKFFIRFDREEFRQRIQHIRSVQNKRHTRSIRHYWTIQRA